MRVVVSQIAWASVAIAVLLSGLAGVCFWQVAQALRRRAVHRERLSLGWDGPSSPGERGGAQEQHSLNDRVIDELIRESYFRGSRVALVDWLVRKASSSWLESSLRMAGLADRVTADAYVIVSIKMAVAGCLVGALVGLLFSTELCLLLGALGFLLGWRLVKSAIEGRVRERADSMERHLAEMLDVVALGMRSGLSFDRSLSLYCGYFSTSLSESFSLAQQQWSYGLESRDEALRQVASTFDSSLLARVVENVIRSLRFGSSLAESLEASAAQARADFRTKKEEQVAKAPVKMMIPTSTLILPAMLILVLGPIMLELMRGF